MNTTIDSTRTNLAPQCLLMKLKDKKQYVCVRVTMPMHALHKMQVTLPSPSPAKSVTYTKSPLMYKVTPHVQSRPHVQTLSSCTKASLMYKVATHVQTRPSCIKLP